MRYLCMTMMLFCFAYTSAFADDMDCFDSCEDDYSKNVSVCDVEYLNALMKCDPKSDDIEECLDNADADYQKCLVVAKDKRRNCIAHCEPIEPEWEPPVIDPVQPFDHKCLANCVNDDTERRQRCAENWDSAMRVCETIESDPYKIICQATASSIYLECVAKSADDFSSCWNGCLTK